MNRLVSLATESPEFVTEFSRESHMVFAYTFLSHMFPIKVPYLFGLFFQGSEMFDHLALASFVGSPAEEVLLYSHVLWRIFGVNEFKNCVVVCGNREKAKEIYDTFSHELLNNPNLRIFRHGVTKKTINGWSITIPNYGAKISVLVYPSIPHQVSFNRGRPDMVIGVDLDHVRTTSKEFDKWLTQVFFNDKHDYLVKMILGNVKARENIFTYLLEIMKRKRSSLGIAVVPLFDEDKKCTWPEKYTEEEQKIMLENFNDEEWQMHNLCHIVSEFHLPEHYFKEDGSIDHERIKKDDSEKKLDIFDSVIYGLYAKQHSHYVQLHPYRFYGLDDVYHIKKKAPE